MAQDRALRIGRYLETVIGGERVRAFIPAAFPPRPPLHLSPLQVLIEAANHALGRLDGAASVLSYTSLFLYMYVRKEALLSSQIEGTQSSLSDLLLFEADEIPAVPMDDVREVSNYVAAMHHGLERLRAGFPLSLRLIREIHATLMARGRDADQMPGEFRRSQNWVGGTRPGNAVYVPPPADRVELLMGELERFLHAETPEIPTVVKAGLAHVQFETIHPFLDGNGRLGRLLITFFLCERGVLREPLLYLSLYLKTHRDAYYDHLMRVRREGDWVGWLRFFLEGVRDTANQAADTARQLLALFEADRGKIESLGRASSSAIRVHMALRRAPMISIPEAAKELQLSQPTVTAALHHLVRLGIVREITGRRRRRVFVYEAYMRMLSEGTEPLDKKKRWP
jgi:Fic family protein